MGLVTLFYKNLTVALFVGIALRETFKYKVYYERLTTLYRALFVKT